MQTANPRGGPLAWSRTDGGRKLVRYAMVSVISVAVSQVALFIASFVFELRPGWANVVAVCAGTIPSYELNRKWAWGKSGRGHLWKEVVPFWALAFIGLVASTVAVDLAGRAVEGASRLVTSLTLNAANLGAFGLLWVGKFVIFNKILFAGHPEDLEPALDGRTGLPS